MEEEVKVSVYTACFNHAKYIRKCLESLVTQKTSFKYEVFVNDDCSTDDSSEIIREYARRYPDIVKPFFQKENQYSKGINILATYILPNVRGKYVAFCEGDDYWTDENKLQLQFDAMEKHPECSICVHRVQTIYENGLKKDDQTYPPLSLPLFGEGVHSSDECVELLVAEAIYLFQTSSYFVRTEVLKGMFFSPPDFVRYANIGDVKLLRFCFNEGNVFYLDRSMSCYRANSIGSWSSRTKSTKAICHYYRSLIDMDCAFDQYTKGKFHNYIEAGCKKREFDMFLRTYQFKHIFSSKYQDHLEKVSRKRFFLLKMLSFLPSVMAKRIYLFIVSVNKCIRKQIC